MIKVISLILLILLSANTVAQKIQLSASDMHLFANSLDDETDQMTAQIAARFLSAKPRKQDWANSEREYVDGWERLKGLRGLLYLHSQHPDFFKLKVELNVRISQLAKLGYPSRGSKDAQHLYQIKKLYLDYARLNMDNKLTDGQASYAQYYAVNSHVQRLAEKVRGAPYCVIKSLSDSLCPEVWEQPLPATTAK